MGHNGSEEPGTSRGLGGGPFTLQGDAGARPLRARRAGALGLPHSSLCLRCPCGFDFGS